MGKSLRNEICNIAVEQYHTQPESLWPKSPENVVLRHSNNKKWYGIIMKVHRSKLGLEGDSYIDILDVKADPNMIDSFLLKEGILPGYHMNKRSWITILLDGTVPMETIELLLDISYELIDKKQKKTKKRLTCM